MLKSFVLFAFFTIAFVTADIDEGEYGKYNKWRKAVCERKNRTLHEDIDVCFKTESNIIIDAATDCMKKSLPGSNGYSPDFMEVACEDKSLLIKFDECYTEYEADEEFKREEQMKKETIECYRALLQKYGLQEMSFYLDEKEAESSTENHE